MDIKKVNFYTPFNKGKFPKGRGNIKHGAEVKSPFIPLIKGECSFFKGKSLLLFFRGKLKRDFGAFTLVEIMVSITIFSIIMISMISVYILSSDTSAKSDINRAIHENLKSLITEIGEDVIKNGISGVSESSIVSCNFDLVDNNYKKGTKLCLNSSNEYYLAKNVAGVLTRVENSLCEDLNEQCHIVKNGSPLTNSLVSVKDLEFFISSKNVNKVTIKIILQPTIKAGVKPDIIKDSKLIFQTTISERPF